MATSFSSSSAKVQAEKLTLLRLPNEILLQILSQLPRKDLFWNVGMTCQKLFVITCDILKNQVQLSGKISYHELDSRLRIQRISRYKQTLESIVHLTIGSEEDSCLKDCTCTVISTSSPIHQQGLLLRVSISRHDFNCLFNHLKIQKLTQLKGLFIKNDVAIVLLLNYVINELSDFEKCKIECLGLIGFRSDQCEAIVGVLGSTLKYLNISKCYQQIINSKCLFTHDAVRRMISACPKLDHLELYGSTEIADGIKKDFSGITTVKTGLVSPCWKRRALKLREEFCKFGRCGNGLTDQQIMNRLNRDGVDYVPEPLMALLAVASEWHSIR